MRSRSTVVWIAVVAVTVVAAVLLIVVWGHWWPSGSAWYLPAAVALGLLVATGAAWLVATILVLGRRRRWAWWMVVWPVVASVGVVVAFAVRPDFEDERPQFEAVAHQLLDTPGSTVLWDLKIGRFEIGRAFDTSAGDVFFTDEWTTIFSSESGWVYSPDGGPEPPSRDGEFSTEHLDGPWYRYDLRIGV